MYLFDNLRRRLLIFLYIYISYSIVVFLLLKYVFMDQMNRYFAFHFEFRRTLCSPGSILDSPDRNFI